MRLLPLRFRVALHICLFAVVAAQALAFNGKPSGASSSPNSTNRFQLSSKEAERVIASRARQVILALKAGNMARFSTFVHPQKGVRFSPYASVLPDEDRVLKRNQLSQFWASNKRYLWGSYDGSGDPIRVTFRKYYRQFIFDHDFSRAKDMAYNPENMSHGNTPNNIRAIYPESIAVEYHFSGFDERVSGHDWVSLWLVFEKRGSVWYVVGIVHDQWTI